MILCVVILYVFMCVCAQQRWGELLIAAPLGSEILSDWKEAK
jgi:hypothetical protein